jgi:hypothetical protein
MNAWVIFTKIDSIQIVKIIPILNDFVVKIVVFQVFFFQICDELNFIRLDTGHPI